MASLVIIPMTFSNESHLNEIRTGLGRAGHEVRHFCLRAPLGIVRARLAGRGEAPGDPRSSWVHQRAEECCVAHASNAFRVHVSTAGRSPAEIAADIAAELGLRT